VDVTDHPGVDRHIDDDREQVATRLRQGIGAPARTWASSGLSIGGIGAWPPSVMLNARPLTQSPALSGLRSAPRTADSAEPARDHPRERGEQVTGMILVASGLGPSPRVRAAGRGRAREGEHRPRQHPRHGACLPPSPCALPGSAGTQLPAPPLDGLCVAVLAQRRTGHVPVRADRSSAADGSGTDLVAGADPSGGVRLGGRRCRGGHRDSPVSAPGVGRLERRSERQLRRSR